MGVCLIWLSYVTHTLFTPETEYAYAGEEKSPARGSEAAA